MSGAAGRRRRTASILGALLALFGLRVAGQALVAFAGETSLPPMEQWQSGILPYPVLLASQLAILALGSRICLEVGRGEGTFGSPRAWLRHGALWFGRVYFAAMIVRYAVQMQLHPEAPWFGHTIPIVFHLVLASFVLVFARSHRARPIA